MSTPNLYSNARCGLLLFDREKACEYLQNKLKGFLPKELVEQFNQQPPPTRGYGPGDDPTNGELKKWGKKKHTKSGARARA